MKRHPSASPGGPAHSSLKKARLQGLAGTMQPAQVPAQRSATALQKPQAVHFKPQQVQQQEMGSSAAAQLGVPPYAMLDAAVAQGPLAAHLQGSTSLVFEVDTNPAAFRRSKISRISGSQASGPGRGDHRGTLELLADQLLITNKSLAARGPEARAAAGLRVRDRNVLLDNPQSSSLTASRMAAARQDIMFSTGLQTTRAGGKCVLQPRGAVTYKQLQCLHTLWQKYMADTLDCASNPAVAASPAAALPRLLLSADMHGCSLLVVACTNPLHVGRQGIVAQVTSRTLLVLDCEERMHVIPKAGSLFEYQLLDGRKVQVQGNLLLQQEATKGSKPNNTKKRK